MLYTLTRKKNSVVDALLDGVSDCFKNMYHLLYLTYRNEQSDMSFSCQLDCNENPISYKIDFSICDDKFGHIFKEYKTNDFVKVCCMIKFLKELVESADYYGEKETKNETLYKECIKTICQYINNGGKLDEFDGYFEEL